MQTYRDNGYGVLLVEFPGYGRSTGSPSETSIQEAMVAGYDWLIARGADPSQIIGHGRSMGGGAICALATERELAALVLQQTFTSLRSFAPRFGAPSFMIRDPFDNLAVVSEFAGPVLVVHGRADRVIPFAQGEQLAAAAPDASMRAHDFGHNDFEMDAIFADVLPFLHERVIRMSVEP